MMMFLLNTLKFFEIGFSTSMPPERGEAFVSY